MPATVQEMIEFLRPEEKPRRVNRPRPVNRGVGRMSLRRKLPHRVRQAIVIFAYGSDTDFTRKIMTPARLAKHLNLSRKTVSSVLRAFEKQGKNLDGFQDQRQARRIDFSMIPQRVQEELLSQDLLQRWGHHTLVDR